MYQLVFLILGISMRIDIFSIFPDQIDQMSDLSILGRARKSGLVDLRSQDLRMATTDKHRTVDDSPFGGGPGMVLKPEPVFAAVKAVSPPRPLILLGPGGKAFDQAKANELSKLDGFSLLCGRYEGVDERIRSHLVDDEISIGDMILAGGEFAAMAVVEAVVRLIPGVLNNDASPKDETFSDGLLEYPHWTRPANFEGLEVPEILVSGDHEKIRRWRKSVSIALTAAQRPDLLQIRGVKSFEIEWLDEFEIEIDPRFFS
jgi:tRNA (guanine37-N1)-methyltransferase